MTTSDPSIGPLRRYELVAEVLRRNIAAGNLAPGQVLMEGPLAERMQTSRAPVQSALRQLAEEGCVHRHRGRGYVVGPDSSRTSPQRDDIRKMRLDIAPEIAEALATRGTWQHFNDRVEREVAACLIFGEFRIVEADLAASLGVSRTVARDILGRLHERGLIRKNQSSHWNAGPLTAEDMRNRFQLRALLEPEALRQAGPYIDERAKESLETLLDTGGSVASEHLEETLFESCLSRAPNRELVDVVRRVQFLPRAANRALTSLGLPDDPVAQDEYRVLIDLLLRHRITAAAEVLRAHLDLLARKSLARLKIVAVVGSGQNIAPYLTEI